MAAPPSYEETVSGVGGQAGSCKTDSKRFSIRAEVGASRSQHVATLVSRLLPRVRERAKQGLSKSTLLLLPSNQDCSREGQLVGFSEDENPILIQLEGGQDTLEFWIQQEALDELQKHIFAAISDEVPIRTMAEPPLPERHYPPPAVKSSFFSRKQSKPSEAKLPPPKPAQPSVSVDVQLDTVHFRSETEYGLYETRRGWCVLVSVVVG